MINLAKIVPLQNYFHKITQNTFCYETIFAKLHNIFFMTKLFPQNFVKLLPQQNIFREFSQNTAFRENYSV